MKSEASHSHGNLILSEFIFHRLRSTITTINPVSVSSYITMRGEHSTNTNLNHHRDAPPHTTTMAAHQYNTIYNIITPYLRKEDKATSILNTTATSPLTTVPP